MRRYWLTIAMFGLGLAPVLAQDLLPLPPQPTPSEEGAEEAGPPGEATTALGGALPEPRPDDLEGEPADADIEDLVSDLPSAEADNLTCASRLKALNVTFEQRDAIEGEGGCGLARPFVVSAIDGVALEGPATLNCETAEALALLMRDHIKPAAETHLQSEPSAIGLGSSYVCRGRNGRPGGKLSEHATGNGVDIMSIAFEGRERIVIAAGEADAPEARVLARIRAGACELFTTVLGPGADAAHANHFHLDLRGRKNDYRICQ